MHALAEYLTDVGVHAVLSAVSVSATATTVVSLFSLLLARAASVDPAAKTMTAIVFAADC